ncbi:MAG: ABC transporter ATP-binding protein [Myxococcota bacterium]
MTLRRYLVELRPYAGSLWLAASLLTLTAAIPATVVALVHQIVSAMMANQPSGRGALALVGLGAVHGGALVARTWLTKRVAWSLAADLRIRVHRAYLHGAPGGVLGDRLARLGDEIDQVQYGVSALVTALRNPLTLLGLAGVTVWLAPQAAGLGLLILAPVVVGAAWGGRAVRRWSEAQRSARADWMGLVTAQLAGLETVQALGAEGAEHERFVQATERDRAARLVLDVGRTLPRMGVQALVLFAIGLVVIAPWAPLNDVVAVLAAAALAQRPLGGLAEVWALLQRSLGALARVDEALATVPRIVEPTDPHPPPPAPWSLRWVGVGWTVDGRDILHDVSLEARPGRILAIVGPTGAGKTSLLRLAWRAMDPSRGTVEVGGVDLRRWHAADRQAALAVVPQDLVLWGRSVRENLLFGQANVADANLLDALRQAQLELDLDTVLAESARGWSGGERQRLCLARAFARGAGIWLLDEPTSQLDALTTSALGEILQRAKVNRTIVVVAHDPVLVQFADDVVAIEGGRRCGTS